MLFMRYSRPSQPTNKLPTTLNAPIKASELAATVADSPQSCKLPGKCVTRKAM